MRFRRKKKPSRYQEPYVKVVVRETSKEYGILQEHDPYLLCESDMLELQASEDSVADSITVQISKIIC